MSIATSTIPSANDRLRICGIIRSILDEQYSGCMSSDMLRAVVQELYHAGENALYVAEILGYCYADDVLPGRLSDSTFNAIAAHVASDAKLAKIWAAAKNDPITLSFAVHHNNIAYYSVNVLQYLPPKH